jgi:hypothetical protein
MGFARFLTLSISLLALVVLGCEPPDDRVIPSGSSTTTVDNGIPHVIGLEADTYRIGETAYFFGENFLEPDEGRTFLEFEGLYVWEDSEGKPVLEQLNGFTVNPIYDGEFTEAIMVGGRTIPAGMRVLRWNRFGPFEVPFGAEGRRAGVFTGQVRAVNVYKDGTEKRDENPVDLEINVEPSILITRFEPVIGVAEDGAIRTAECSSPALRAFGGMPYVLEVEAMGFTPEYFIYDISNINGDVQIKQFNHAATGQTDSLGDPALHDNEIVVFNTLLEDEGSAIASIRVTAVDENNNHYETGLPLRIVRPVAFHSDGSRQIAEYYEPELVHGPFTGSIGTTINYQESHSEARQRGVSVTLTQSFTQSNGSVQTENWSEAFSQSNTTSQTNSVGQSHSEGETASDTYGTSYNQSEANNVNVSSTDGTSWGWNTVEGQSESTYKTQVEEAYGEVSAGVSTEVGAEGSIPGFAKVSGKVGTQVGTSVGGKQAFWENETAGKSSSSGNHMDSSTSDTKGFGSTTTDSVGSSFSGTYALSSQSSLSQTDSKSESQTDSTTYSMGGSGSLSENFSQGSQESWSETWQESSTDTSLFSMSGVVPNGKCAAVWRQTVRHVRVGHLYNYDLCGVRSMVGELYFNEWSWSPNIAIGDDCNVEVPPSTLPEAGCFTACE